MSDPYSTNLDRPTTEILDSLRSAALQNTASADLKIGLIAVPFGTLLVKLGQETQETADTIRRFTKGLLLLTFALFALTVALLAMQAYQIYQYENLNRQSAESRNNSDQNPNTAPR